MDFSGGMYEDSLMALADNSSTQHKKEILFSWLSNSYSISYVKPFTNVRSYDQSMQVHNMI